MNDSTQWTALCPAAQLETGDAKAFCVGDKRLCLVNGGDAYYAVDDLCTHGMAYLSDGFCDLEEGVLECPLHGGLFSYRDGRAQGAPVEKPVKSYPIEIADGMVRVRL